MTDAERKALMKAIKALQARLDDHVDATVETLTKDYTAAIRSELADAYDALPTDDDGRFDDQAIADVLPRVRRKLLTTDDVYRTIGEAWLRRLDATAEQVRQGFEVDPGQQRVDFTRFDVATIDELKGQWPRDGEPGGGLAGRFFSLTDEHRRALADALTRAVLGRRNERELIAELSETVAKDGRSAKWLFDDGTMQFSRSVTLRKADSLGYEWFRYNGPQDSITRPFCSHLVDTVHTRAEIDAMDNRQTGAGTVMIAGGGYRCRHHWRPVRPEWFTPEEWAAMGGSVEAPTPISEPPVEDAPQAEPTAEAPDSGSPQPGSLPSDHTAQIEAAAEAFREIDGKRDVYYHGTTQRFLRISDGMDLNIADDRDIAAAYASDRRGAFLHAIEIKGGRFADEEDMWDAAAPLFGFGPDDDFSHYDFDDWRKGYVFELADDPEVRAALAEQGFDGVRYEDLSPNNEDTHATLRIWSAGVVGRVGTVDLSEIEN